MQERYIAEHVYDAHSGNSGIVLFTNSVYTYMYSRQSLATYPTLLINNLHSIFYTFIKTTIAQISSSMTCGQQKKHEFLCSLVSLMEKLRTPTTSDLRKHRIDANPAPSKGKKRSAQDMRKLTRNLCDHLSVRVSFLDKN